ncbi:MAG: alpha-amylase family glycosyl hydrolase [Candidatus Dormibacteraceae bacterium]
MAINFAIQSMDHSLRHANVIALDEKWYYHLAKSADRWWKEGVIYQIYPRSFQDSNGDGIGDLNGIIQRLDYLSWLGVDAIWLNPIMPSPNVDWGYDVSDYTNIHPDFGTLEDFDRLLNAAHTKGIRVVLDLVPNHTSDQHFWFQDARSSRSSRYRDWYIWTDAKLDGSPPNNWLCCLGNSAWEFDQTTSQYYLHTFHPAQPDLNWWNPEVRQAFDQILEFWYARGIDGFRVDVAQGLIHDRQLHDDPKATKDELRFYPFGLLPIYSMHRLERHEIFRYWHQLSSQADPPRMLLAESGILSFPELANYYGNQDEFDLTHNFWFIQASLQASDLSEIVTQVEANFSKVDWPTYTGSNHDAGRLASRWCNGDERKVRCALMMLLTLRGTPILYYGDEIGLSNVEVPDNYSHDQLAFDPQAIRDPGRTPMPWEPGKGAGFTKAAANPWLPIGQPDSGTVAEQHDQENSILRFARSLTQLRRQLPELRTGNYQQIYLEQGTWAWRRGEQIVVALNLSERDDVIPRIKGEILLSTREDREGELVDGQLNLTAFEGAILRRSDS